MCNFMKKLPRLQIPGRVPVKKEIVREVTSSSADYFSCMAYAFGPLFCKTLNDDVS